MEIQSIPVEKIYLDLANPRHEEVKSEREAIEYLLREEQVMSLAADIKKNKVSVLNVLALVKEKNGNFTVIEGNRRICALKLLADHSLAPNEAIKKKLAGLKGNHVPTTVNAVVYKSRKDKELLLWRERAHGGPDGGRGQRPWNAEQKARHTGHRKNLLAQHILDYAEAKGWITKEERKNRISTVEKYLANSYFRENLGLEFDDEEFRSDVSQEEFDTIVKKFIRDVADKIINTRSGSTKDKIVEYVKDLPPVTRRQKKKWSSLEVDSNTEDPETSQSSRDEDEDTSKNVDGEGSGRNNPPPKPTRLERNEELLDLIKDHSKIASIHHSITTLPLQGHVCLMTVGVWSFLESITGLAGRKEDSFVAYLSQVINTPGHGYDRETKKRLKAACERLHNEGNIVKHDNQAGLFSQTQLASDWANLMPVILIVARTLDEK